MVMREYASNFPIDNKEKRLICYNRRFIVTFCEGSGLVGGLRRLLRGLSVPKMTIENAAIADGVAILFE